MTSTNSLPFLPCDNEKHELLGSYVGLGKTFVCYDCGGTFTLTKVKKINPAHLYNYAIFTGHILKLQALIEEPPSSPDESCR